MVKKINLKTHCLEIIWQDGDHDNYDYLWLRDNCPSAFHPDTKERNFDLLAVSQDIKANHYTLEGNTLIIDWSEGNHCSHFNLHWLKQHSNKQNNPFIDTPKAIIWQGKPDITAVDYEKIMTDDQQLYHWLHQISQYGLSFVKAMPNNTSALEHIARRIGHLRETNFGTTFDVQSKPKPNNQAYTAENLPLHTDLPNQEIPPGYQFLHCLENTASGGESVFVDGFCVADALKQQQTKYFDLLCKHALDFRFHDNHCDIRQKRPVISLVDGQVNEISFNAHLASTFDFPDAIMRDYYLAYRAFISLLRDKRFVFETKLKSGEMVVFDNRRVLHGRKAFEANSGKRHLRGCYVDRTEFNSRLRVLKQTINNTD